MNLDHLLSKAKRQHERIVMDDGDAFKAKVRQSLEQSNVMGSALDLQSGLEGSRRWASRLKQIRRFIAGAAFMSAGTAVAAVLIATIMIHQGNLSGGQSGVADFAPAATGSARWVLWQNFGVPYYGILSICVVILAFLGAAWMEGSRRLIRIFRTSTFWGTVAGVIIGYVGIPVPVPAMHYWMWEHPSGYCVPSVLVFGTVGCLVGIGVQRASGKVMPRRIAVAVLGTCSLALVLGLVGFYRLEASNQDAMWTLARLGLERVSGVSQNLSKQTADLQVKRGYGEELVVAGADVGAASHIASPYNINLNLDELAGALNQAGYNLILGTDTQTAQKFATEIGELVDQTAQGTRGQLTNATVAQILEQAIKDVPPAYSNGWSAN